MSRRGELFDVAAELRLAADALETLALAVPEALRQGGAREVGLALGIIAGALSEGVERLVAEQRHLADQSRAVLS